MGSLGPYASFIVGAYATCALVVLALIAGVVLDYRRQRRLLGDLEARGVSRRSAQNQAQTTSAKEPV